MINKEDVLELYTNEKYRMALQQIIREEIEHNNNRLIDRMADSLVDAMESGRFNVIKKG